MNYQKIHEDINATSWWCTCKMPHDVVPFPENHLIQRSQGKNR